MFEPNELIITDLMGEKSEFRDKLIQNLFNDAMQSIADLKKILELNNEKLVKFELHKLKQLVQYLGLNEVAQKLKFFELNYQNNLQQEISNFIQDLGINLPNSVKMLLTNS